MSASDWTQPISDQVSAVHGRRVSSETLVRRVRAAIEHREPDLAAWVELSDGIVDEARSIDAAAPRSPLQGISVGVKDLIDVAGLPTRAGSTVTPPGPATADAACVARLRELGAVVQGKTVTTEFGYFAPGPTRNPHAPTHTPGGSSSGSAAAVGAGTVPIALGTQTAGSVTRPAAYCGAAAMVLAHGTADLSGITGLSGSLDSLGIFTRTVADLDYVHAAFTGRPAEVRSVSPAARALVWYGSDLDAVHPAMQRLLTVVSDVLRDAGLSCTSLDWDDHVRTLADDHPTVMAHEAAQTLHAVYERDRSALSAPLLALVRDGRTIPEDARTAALIRRDRSRELLAEILTDDTVVVGPAALGPAPDGLGATGSPVLSRPWQLLGAPVVVVPGARTTAGLPLGLQLVGRPGHEPALLATAAVLEPLLRAMPAMPA